MSGAIHNQPHNCGPANAQNQQTLIYLQEQALAQLVLLNSMNQQGTGNSQLKGKVEFSYGDVSEQLMYTALNTLIIQVVLVVIEPFDGGAQVSVGDATNSHRLMAIASNNLSQAATYETHPGYHYTTETAINLYLSNTGGSTQGKGIIFLYGD